jgi:hypothetical protein
MTPGEELDALIAAHPDWRGVKLAELRASILAVDPGIYEEWKWMGSPVWEHTGILCVGGIYKNKAKLTFQDGAALPDPTGLFNAELEGNKRRAIDFFEDDQTDDAAFQNLIRAAIDFNEAKVAAKAAAKIAAKAQSKK